MTKSNFCKYCLFILFVAVWQKPVHAQFLMDFLDTTKSRGRGLLNMYEKYDHLTIQGYMQPQFQWANAKGAGGNIFEGGPFGAQSNNRFRLRRGRVRFDYAIFNKQNKPVVQFAFQFDGTEKGVVIKDFWGRIWENKYEMFMFTTGMFARPFGWEINYSSQDREVPERGRMSQLLLQAERDLGFMTTFNSRKAKGNWRNFKAEVGIFNGPGLPGGIEFDSFKDIIGQVVMRSTSISRKVMMGGGVSFLMGKIGQNHRMRYQYGTINGLPAMVPDSSHAMGSGAPRQYVGANFQVIFKQRNTNTQFRAEYWQGRQSALQGTSETPPMATTDPIFVRRFNGGFFYLLQDIVSPNNQLLLKYDFYNPNTDVPSAGIGAPGSKLGMADIAYHTLGVGALHRLNDYTKLVLMYNFVRNQGTQLPGATGDIKDDIMTCRLQFRF